MQVTNSYGNTCPSCYRNKYSLSTLEDGTELGHCFSASCGFNSCKRPTGVAYPSVIHITPERASNPYQGEIVPLPPEQKTLLATEAGFNRTHLGISRPMYAALSGRVAFPLLSPTGNRQGWCLRSYEGLEPKALTYLDKGSSKLSHYNVHDSRAAILVEDIPSAVRAAPYINSVALLGTSLCEDDRNELGEHYDRLIIALDADASAQAIRLQRQLRLAVKECDVLILGMDIKDMEEGEVAQLLVPLGEELE